MLNTQQGNKIKTLLSSHLTSIRKQKWTIEMVPQVKAVATQPGDLSSITGEQGKSTAHGWSSELYMDTMARAHRHSHTQQIT